MKFNTLFKKRTLFILIQYILGLIFIYSGLIKILNPKEFLDIVNSYEILPPILAKILAIALPWIEFLLGSFLLLGLYVKQCAVIISSFLILFIIVIVINLIRGVEFSCGCFSVDPSEGKENAVMWIFRDILMLALGISLYLYSKKKELL